MRMPGSPDPGIRRPAPAKFAILRNCYVPAALVVIAPANHRRAWTLMKVMLLRAASAANRKCAV